MADIDKEALGARVSQLEARVSKLEGAGLAARAHEKAPPKRLSAKEFMMTKDAGSELQRVVVLAFYLERYEGLETFNVTDLENAFRSARERPPKNMNDAVNKNISRGFFMEAVEKKNSRKAWQLTSTGERFIEADLAD